VDVLVGGGGVDTLNGGNGDDFLRGGALADVVNGDAGNDTLIVFDGEFIDDFDGGSGADTADLSGFDTEAVTVNLAAGTWSVAGLNSSTLTDVEHANGGGGDDLLTGNTAANTLKGGSGSDTLNGGDGNDRLYGFTSANPTGSTDADTVNGGAGNDTITASNGADVIVGGAGLDIIGGNGGNDTVNGGDDTDRIDGGSGDDRLNGGLGIDGLTGGLGRDVMTGGGEVDIFDFNAIAETGITGATRDVITDFNAGTSTTSVDRIDLSTIGGFTFGGNLTAVQAGAHVLIRLNTDADAAPEAIIQLSNVNLADVNAGDFFV
jgi:Ca2+-binding RTX toxin-like protein